MASDSSLELKARLALWLVQGRLADRGFAADAGSA